MTTKIEFHILQSFPPANLNRDDTNTPKDCEFGGVRRARVSSQCLKRSIRLHPDFAAATGVQPAERTRLLAREISKALQSSGRPAEEAEKVARGFTATLLGGMDEKKPDHTKVLFYISAEERAEIARRLNADWEKATQSQFDEMLKDYHGLFAKRSSAPDIALFGRMLADDPKLSLDAACQVAHAISTHKVSMESDFYTAVDDLQPKEDSGAGMMGIVNFNSATFYRYATIDWDLLLANLNGNASLAQCTVLGFLRGAVKGIPTGKQNGFAAQTPPGLVMVVVRADGQAWSLANAFEKPVPTPRNGDGYLGSSAAALLKHWERLNQAYGDPQRPAQVFVLALDDIFHPEMGTAVTRLAELEERVRAALERK